MCLAFWSNKMTQNGSEMQTVPISLALGWLHLRLHVFAHGQLTLETQLQLLGGVARPDSIDLSTGCQTRLSGDDWYV